MPVPVETIDSSSPTRQSQFCKNNVRKFHKRARIPLSFHSHVVTNLPFIVALDMLLRRFRAIRRRVRCGTRCFACSHPVRRAALRAA